MRKTRFVVKVRDSRTGEIETLRNVDTVIVSEGESTHKDPSIISWLNFRVEGGELLTTRAQDVISITMEEAVTGAGEVEGGGE